MEGKYLLIVDYGTYEGHDVMRYETEEELIDAISEGQPFWYPIIVAKELELKTVITEEDPHECHPPQ